MFFLMKASFFHPRVVKDMELTGGNHNVFSIIFFFLHRKFNFQLNRTPDRKLLQSPCHWHHIVSVHTPMFKFFAVVPWLDPYQFCHNRSATPYFHGIMGNILCIFWQILKKVFFIKPLTRNHSYISSLTKCWIEKKC